MDWYTGNKQYVVVAPSAFQDNANCSELAILNSLDNDLYNEILLCYSRAIPDIQENIISTTQDVVSINRGHTFINPLLSDQDYLSLPNLDGLWLE